MKKEIIQKEREIIHGAGQSPNAFKKYCGAVGRFKPKIYMFYLRIDTLKEKLPEKIKEMQGFSKKISAQIGLNLKSKKKGKQIKEILEGVYDSNLIFLAKSLKELKNISYLRIGYEFNNPTHDYNPGEFVRVWNYIARFFREEKANNVKFVWNCCTAFNKDILELMPYYPGDENVNWFGDDLFGVKSFKDNNQKITENFYKLSEIHKKPFMICESSAIRTGVLEGQKSWDAWFKPYFKWIKNHSNVKAFCYIDWDWAKDWKQPEWGNCRIEENKIVRKKYVQELKKPIYEHLK